MFPWIRDRAEQRFRNTTKQGVQIEKVDNEVLKIKLLNFNSQRLIKLNKLNQLLCNL